MFDTSKEIHYKVKYKQTFEEAISSNEDDEIYVLNLDAQKMYSTFYLTIYYIYIYLYRLKCMMLNYLYEIFIFKWTITESSNSTF